jgi:hypothetical protein
MFPGAFRKIHDGLDVRCKAVDEAVLIRQILAVKGALYVQLCPRMGKYTETVPENDPFFRGIDGFRPEQEKKCII